VLGDHDGHRVLVNHCFGGRRLPHRGWRSCY
jgi:hypothetical protein